jgi:hypothetical protein
VLNEQNTQQSPGAGPQAFSERSLPAGMAAPAYTASVNG